MPIDKNGVRFDGNHHFEGTQQVEYDSLSAKGRTAYDELRWYADYPHNVALMVAKAVYGTKREQYVRSFERMGCTPEEAVQEADSLIERQIGREGI